MRNMKERSCSSSSILASSAGRQEARHEVMVMFTEAAEVSLLMDCHLKRMQSAAVLHFRFLPLCVCLTTRVVLLPSGGDEYVHFELLYTYTLLFFGLTLNIDHLQIYRL